MHGHRRGVKTRFHGGNRESIRGWCAATALLVLLVCVGDLCAQVSTASPPPPRQPTASPLRHTIAITGGMSWPVSRAGITQYWESGPAASVNFHVAVNRYVALGLSVEAAKLRFNESSFTAIYPDIPVQKDDVVWTNISVDGKLSLMPRMVTCPYVTASVGASRLTEALYRVLVDGERRTYYNVGGSTRLTMGLAAGADIYINHRLALELEARGIYVHNDPDFGVAASARGGLRFSF